MGVDWGQATAVAISGVTSVFAVLLILQIAVTVAGGVIESFTKKQAEKQSG